MKMFLSSKWQDRSETIDVLNPFDQSVIDTVPKGSTDDLNSAVESLQKGAAIMRKLTALERSQILRKTSELMRV